MNKKALILIPISLFLLTSCGSSKDAKIDHHQMVNRVQVTEPAITCVAHQHSVGNGTLKSIDGLNLEINNSEKFIAGSESTLSLSIKDSTGNPVSDFAIVHTKPMHLILVKKNLDGYLHLHPTVDENGNWSVPVNFPSGGIWQIISDVETLDGKGYNLGSYINVSGDDKSFTLPSPTDKITVDGIDLTVAGEINPDSHGMLMVTATKDGNPVELSQYLGANAHLVAIKTDGSYAHMHPHSMKSMEACADGEMPVNDPYAEEDAKMGMMHFMTEVPGSGTYRLFLQFMTGGVIHTAMFTAEVN